MKTVEEVGNDVARLILSGKWTTHDLSAVLLDFAEERAVETANATISEACKEARAEALEEAAKVAERIFDRRKPESISSEMLDTTSDVAKAIRALKENL